MLMLQPLKIVQYENLLICFSSREENNVFGKSHWLSSNMSNKETKFLEKFQIQPHLPNVSSRSRLFSSESGNICNL